MMNNTTYDDRDRDEDIVDDIDEEYDGEEIDMEDYYNEESNPD